MVTHTHTNRNVTGPDPLARNTSYGAYTHTNLVIANNTVRGTRKNTAITLLACVDCTVSGNVVTSPDPPDAFEPTSDQVRSKTFLIRRFASQDTFLPSL
jgi:hypothetical protein